MRERTGGIMGDFPVCNHKQVFKSKASPSSVPSHYLHLSSPADSCPIPQLWNELLPEFCILTVPPAVPHLARCHLNRYVEGLYINAQLHYVCLHSSLSNFFTPDQIKVSPLPSGTPALIHQSSAFWGFLPSTKPEAALPPVSCLYGN